MVRPIIGCFTTVRLALTSGTFCGVFRRQALDRGAMILNCNKIVTGKLGVVFFSSSDETLHGTTCRYLPLWNGAAQL